VHIYCLRRNGPPPGGQQGGIRVGFPFRDADRLHLPCSLAMTNAA
jgi:hypothetical protein